MFVTTPSEISEELKSFCRSICKKYEPEFVPLEVRNSSRPGECFSNVKKVIDAEGGRQIFGWTIWIRPGVFVEAENHSVWQDRANKLVDVSGTLDGEGKVLFLRDDAACPVGGIGKNNRRKALNSDPLVKRFVTLGNAIGHATIKLKQGGMLDPSMKEKVFESTTVTEQLYAKYGHV
jgi:hypothetical protein